MTKRVQLEEKPDVQIDKWPAAKGVAPLCELVEFSKSLNMPTLSFEIKQSNVYRDVNCDGTVESLASVYGDATKLSRIPFAIRDDGVEKNKPHFVYADKKMSELLKQYEAELNQ